MVEGRGLRQRRPGERRCTERNSTTQVYENGKAAARDSAAAKWLQEYGIVDMVAAGVAEPQERNDVSLSNIVVVKKAEKDGKKREARDKYRCTIALGWRRY